MTHTTEKETRIEDLSKYIENNTKAIEDLLEVLTALEQWDKKTVDKRFFEKFFTSMNETTGKPTTYYNGSICTKYRLSNPTYTWAKHSYEMYIRSEDSRIEFMSRETAYLIEVIKEEITKRQNWISNYQVSITSLKDFDEQALIDDLVALFNKHGKPQVWSKVLDSYAVKYPNER